jgi:hypothetical protein
MSALLRLPLSTHPEGKVVGEVHGGVGVYSIVAVGSWTPVPLSTHPEGKVVGRYAEGWECTPLWRWGRGLTGRGGSVLHSLVCSNESLSSSSYLSVTSLNVSQVSMRHWSKPTDGTSSVWIRVVILSKQENVSD